MNGKKQAIGSSSPRAKAWASLITTSISLVAGLLSAVSYALPELLGGSSQFRELSWFLALAAAGAAVLISVGFTVVLAKRERGPARVAKLKSDLADAYLKALDSSAFNPKAGRSR